MRVELLATICALILMPEFDFQLREKSASIETTRNPEIPNRQIVHRSAKTSNIYRAAPK